MALSREREILVCAKQSEERERGLERERESQMRKRAKHALAVAAVEFAIFFHARF